MRKVFELGDKNLQKLKDQLKAAAKTAKAVAKAAKAAVKAAAKAAAKAPAKTSATSTSVKRKATPVESDVPVKRRKTSKRKKPRT